MLRSSRPKSTQRAGVSKSSIGRPISVIACYFPLDMAHCAKMIVTNEELHNDTAGSFAFIKPERIAPGAAPLGITHGDAAIVALEFANIQRDFSQTMSTCRHRRRTF